MTFVGAKEAATEPGCSLFRPYLLMRAPARAPEGGQIVIWPPSHFHGRLVMTAYL